MSLSTKDIQHLARLARLKLTPVEASQYSREIGGILRYVDRLSSLPEVKGSKDSGKHNNKVTDLSARTDLVLPSLDDEKALALKQANIKKGQVIVPRIFS